LKKLIAFGIFLMLPGMVAAQPTQGVQGSVQDIFFSIFDIILMVSAIIFIVMFLIGGLQYLTSAGDVEQAAKSRRLLLNAAIGIGIVVTAWAISTYVLGLLGINIEQLFLFRPIGS
jgi:hypothetical protein